MGDEEGGMLPSRQLGEPNGEPRTEIRINDQRFLVARVAMSGAELRALATPPLDPDVDLFQESTLSEAGDLLVADGQVVDLETGVRFFTSPTTILAGYAAYPAPYFSPSWSKT